MLILIEWGEASFSSRAGSVRARLRGHRGGDGSGRGSLCCDVIEIQLIRSVIMRHVIRIFCDLNRHLPSRSPAELRPVLPSLTIRVQLYERDRKPTDTMCLDSMRHSTVPQLVDEFLRRCRFPCSRFPSLLYSPFQSSHHGSILS